jgi:hypothetical protein
VCVSQRCASHARARVVDDDGERRSRRRRRRRRARTIAFDAFVVEG